AFLFLVNNRILNLALHLYSLEGACIFAVASPAVQGARGLWEGVCVIPGDFLNDGAYTISMMIVQDQSLCLYNLDRALSFEIADFREAGAWHGKWPGAVRPKNISFTLQRKDRMSGDRLSAWTWATPAFAEWRILHASYSVSS